jgi:hypothetical protein
MPLAILPCAIEGFELKKDQTCPRRHPVPFLFGNVSPDLMPTLRLTPKVARQRVVIMMEESADCSADTSWIDININPFTWLLRTAINWISLNTRRHKGGVKSS